MLADWSAECSADAPTLVVPWSDPQTGARFHNLRLDPYALAEIPEADRFPALQRALRSLNANRSPVLTAKCDAWSLDPGHPGSTSHRFFHAASSHPDSDFPTSRSPDPGSADDLSALAAELDLDPGQAWFGFASYIDLVWRERRVFASAHLQSDRMDRLVRRAARLPHPFGSLQLVLRPAMLALGSDLGSALGSAPDTPAGPALEGFAITAYVTALGEAPDAARSHWAAALDDVVGIVRSRDLEPARNSATIDAG